MPALLNARRGRRTALVLAAALALALVGRAWLRHTVDGHLQQAVRLLPGAQTLVYRKLQVRPWPPYVQAEEAEVIFAPGVDPIRVQRIQVVRFAPGRPLPGRIAAVLAGVKLPADHPLLAAAGSWLTELGYRELAGNIDLDAERTEAATGGWRLQLALRVQALGVLRAALSVRGLDAGGVAAAWRDPVVWLRVLPPVAIETAALEFEDQGWGERFVRWRGRQSGEDPETARHHIETQLRHQAATTAPGALQALIAQAARFIAAPGRIGIYTANPQPVTLGRLALAPDLAQRMRLLQSASYFGAPPRPMPWQSGSRPTSGSPPPS
jgi:hypothetical protein